MNLAESLNHDFKETNPYIYKVKNLAPGQKVLVLDDEPTSLLVISKMIRKLLPKAQILTTSSPEEALDVASEGDIQFGLVDLVLPGNTDGFNVCQRLQALNPNMRLMVISSLNPESFGILCRNRGAHFRFLKKPLRLVDLQGYLL